MHSILNIITSSSEALVSAGYKCMKALSEEIRANCKQQTDYLCSNTIIATELHSGRNAFPRPQKMASSSVVSR